MGTALTPILILVLFSGWIYVQQPTMIFYPTKEISQTPEDWGFPFEDVHIKSSDGVKLHGWYIPNSKTRHVLLFFHGNAGNISHRGESIKVFQQLGLGTLIIDYRGYGKSEGVPGEKGLYVDARAAWQFLTVEKGIKKEDIIIFGRSLGGVVAAKLSSEVQPGHLILESTFSSAKDMAKKVFPVMSIIVPLRFELNAIEYIKKVHSPVLIIHSPNDEIIPYELGEKLFMAANEPKSLLKLRGGHNNGFLLSQPIYEEGIESFIGNHKSQAGIKETGR